MKKLIVLLLPVMLSALTFQTGRNGQIALTKKRIYVIIPLPNGDQLACMDRKGEILWTFEFRGKVLCCDSDDKQLVIVSQVKDPLSSHLTCLNLETGDAIWDR